MNTSKNILVFSTERTENTRAQNIETHWQAFQYLRSLNVSFELATGYYKNIRENSFVVELTENGLNECLVSQLSRKFRQECYLKVTASGQAELVYGFQRRQKIGQWQLVATRLAAKQEASTEVNGLNYIVK
jgi:hypothetical protein